MARCLEIVVRTPRSAAKIAANSGEVTAATAFSDRFYSKFVLVENGILAQALRLNEGWAAPDRLQGHTSRKFGPP